MDIADHARIGQCTRRSDVADIEETEHGRSKFTITRAARVVNLLTIFQRDQRVQHREFEKVLEFPGRMPRDQSADQAFFVNRLQELRGVINLAENRHTVTPAERQIHHREITRLFPNRLEDRGRA